MPWGRSGIQVGSVVPDGFDTYVRIQHRSERPEEDYEGTLPQELADTLAAALADDSGDTERCWLAVWVGWGDAPDGDGVVRHGHGRDYFLVEAPLGAAARPLWSFSGSPWRYQSASLWWPSDRSWCVATEIDAHWTYVAAATVTGRRLLNDRRLTARRVDIRDDFNS